MAKKKDMNREMTAGERVLTSFAALFLGISCIVSGFAFTAYTPFVVTEVAPYTSNIEGSPYNAVQLAGIADAIRDYSIASNDIESLYATVAEVNAQIGSEYAAAGADVLMTAPQTFSIDAAQVEHLNEIYGFASLVMIGIFVVFAITAVLLILSLVLFGPQSLGIVLFSGGIGAIAIMLALLLIWSRSYEAVLGLVSQMLFVEGTWAYPADSLLSRTVTESFWVWTGVVSIAISAAVSLACMIIGGVTRRTARAVTRARRRSAERNALQETPESNTSVDESE